jgi:hypothetical protein
VQKSASHYTEAARDEIKLLEEIREGDPDDQRHCCRLLDWFEHSGPHGRHVCMVFEVLGDNLLALIKEFDYRGIPIPIVRNLTRQVGLDGVPHCPIPIVLNLTRQIGLDGVPLARPDYMRLPPGVFCNFLHCPGQSDWTSQDNGQTCIALKPGTASDAPPSAAKHPQPWHPPSESLTALLR